MKHSSAPFIIFASSLLLLAAEEMETINLVKDGKALFGIVVPEDADEQTKGAAQLLADYIFKSTGARLELIAEGEAFEARLSKIHVGQTAFSKSRMKASDEATDDDGFIIDTNGEGNIVIAGPTGWGTEFGVCEFLERYVGVRWLLPGPDGEDVPRLQTIRVPRERILQQPHFMSRLFSGLRGSVQSTWARRNRMHGRIQFHHNLIRLFPPETYTKSHPHFFPIQKDKRFLPPTNSTHHWQPCFSADGLVEEAVKNICHYFEKNPEAASYSLGINDSGGHCECKDCKAKNPVEKNFLGRRDISDHYFEWCNKVVEGVLQKYPDKYFGCLAYSEIAQSPGRVKVHPRIIPYMTYDRMKWIDPDIAGDGQAQTKKWQKNSPTLGWYDYIYGSPYCLPRVYFHRMSEYYRFGYEHGVRALYAEAYPNWGEGPKLYISLKLQWNPYADVDALLKDWYTRAVGEDAAADLAAYYSHWENFWTKRILQSKWFTRGGQYLCFSSATYLDDVTEEEIARSRELLERVVEKSKTKLQKARARLLLRAFEYYEATAIAWLGSKRTVAGAVDSEKEAVAAVNEGLRYLEMAQKRRHLALSEFPKHPVLVHPLTIERFPLLAGISWGGNGLWQAYDWFSRNGGQENPKLLELAKTHPNEAVRKQAQLMTLMLAPDKKPFSANASFEEAGSWHLWVKWGIGSMRRVKTAAHEGKFSILCKGMKRGGPNQELPVTPGTYGAVAFIRCPQEPKGNATVQLSMILRNGEGRNLVPSPQLTIRPKPGPWMPLVVAGKIPEKVGKEEVKKVLLIVVVDGFEKDEELYIDDLTMFRLGDQ